MSNFISNADFENQNTDPVNEKSSDDDLLMEEILTNINTTPIGKVLKRIATLPECRQEKVLDVRQQLTKGDYDLNERLDIVLEKVLSDIDD